MAMTPTSGNSCRSTVSDSSVEPLSATMMSASSAGVWATTDGRKRLSIAAPFQLSITMAVVMG